MSILILTSFVPGTVMNGAMGTHIYELELSRFLQYMVDFYPMPIIYPLCCMFAKLSLMVFYTRLNPDRAYQTAAWAGIFFIFGSNFGLALATAFPCRPLAAAWDPRRPASCIDRPAAYKATAIMGLLADFWLIFIPIPMVIRLRMPWQQKAGLVAMFGVGVL